MKVADSTTAPLQLKLHQLSHRFGQQQALADVELTLNAGEVLCLVGPSGCGKSTLLRLIAGLERVQNGTITLGNDVIASPKHHTKPEQRDIGLVFQDFALFPHLSLRDNVAFGLHGTPRGERHALALAMLERVHLADRADDFPHQLSGGQQQRVALARALAPRPQLLLLDEPFSNLDIRLRQRMRMDTLNLLKTCGIASILVTHDPDDAMFMADRIALLNSGRIIQLGTPEALYQHPQSPFAAEFFGDVNQLSTSVSHSVVASPFGPITTPELPDGSEAIILIRPEAIKLADSGVAARVVETHLLGATRRLMVMTADSVLGAPVLLQVQTSNDQAPAVGSEVFLQLDPRGAFVFPAEKFSASSAPGSSPKVN